jgi:uncharacterized cupredoxin-like copper-binding protein
MRTLSVFMVVGLILCALPALAWSGKAGIEPVELELSLGSPDMRMEHFFNPNRFDLKLGALYKMTIRNPSHVTHYFSSGDLSYGSFTRRLEMVLPDGTRELRNRRSLRKLELAPGAVVEWTFITSKLGKEFKIYCDLVQHRDAGMIASVVVR